MADLTPIAPPSLAPLVGSYEENQLESDLKKIFVTVFERMVRERERSLNLYGMAHLGDEELVGRNLQTDGLAVIRRDAERMRFLLKAWRARNPRRGMLFLRKVALPATGLYPVAVLALVVVGYGAADLAKASGFLAVYVAAVLLGNVRLPHGPATRGFAEAVGWLAQIGLFVMLGLLDSPSRLPGQILPALAVGAILVVIARPVAVLAATLPFRVPLRQQAFLSWAGLRGAVPIVLTTIPLSARVPGAIRIFWDVDAPATLADDAFDALMCALVARATTQYRCTVPIPRGLTQRARREGWIAVPSCRLQELLAPPEFS